MSNPEAQKHEISSDAPYVSPDTETVTLINKPAERSLCRKFDYRLLPILAIMCTFIPPLPINRP